MQSVGTPDDAIAVLRSALITLDAGAADEHRLACHLGIALGAALTNIGSYEDRESVLEAAWAHASALDDSELLADVLVEAMSSANYPPVNWVGYVEPVPRASRRELARVPDPDDRPRRHALTGPR